MKRIFQIALTVVAGAAFLACDSDDGGAPGKSGKLTVSKADLVYNAEDTAPKSITVTSDAAWTPKNSDEWITYSKENNTLVVSVDANTTRELRTGVITVSSLGAKDIYVNVTQTNARFHLNTDVTALAYEHDGGATAQTVTISTNSVEGWELGSYPEWITVSEDTDSFSVTLADNEETTSRSHDLSITVPELITGVTVRISQTGKPEVVIPGTKVKLSEWRLGAKFAGKTFTVTAPEGGLSTATISANKTWVTHAVVNDNTMTVTVAANTQYANSRKATLSVVSGSETTTVDIVQNGDGLSTDATWFEGYYTAYGTPEKAGAPNFFETIGVSSYDTGTLDELFVLLTFGSSYRLYLTINDEIPCVKAVPYQYYGSGTTQFVIPIVFYFTGASSISILNMSKAYPLCWNPYMMALDLSGQYEGNNLVVALAVYNTNGTFAGTLVGNYYSNLKLYNSISVGAPKTTANAPALPQIDNPTKIELPAGFKFQDGEYHDVKFLTEAEFEALAGN